MNSKEIQIKISLTTKYISAVLPVFQAFTAEYKLEKKAATRFQLAAEEFLTYLQGACGTEQVEIMIFENGKYLSMRFCIKQESIDLSGLNLIDIYKKSYIEDDLESMSLLLAGRSVDEFNVSIEEGQYCITASIERTFEQLKPYAIRPTIKPPYKTSQNRDILLLSFQIAKEIYPDMAGNSYFRNPYSFLADYDKGYIQAFCITDEKETPAAIVIWRVISGTAIFKGPYVLSQNNREDIGGHTIEQLIMKLAKQNIICMITEESLYENSGDYFDFVNGVHYRLMEEDNGGNLWVPDQLKETIQKHLEKMELTRQIISAQGSFEAERSLISTNIVKEENRINMTPNILGRDFEQVLEAHIVEFEKRCFDIITIELKLTDRQQALAAGIAGAMGFKLWYLIPGEGISDRVVLRYER